MTDCLFCKMVNGDIPPDKVYEDDHVLSFNDINPQAPVHILVIPKGEYISVSDFGVRATQEEMVALWQAVSNIADDHGLSGSGFRVIANTGINGGQEVSHFHVHILGGKPLGPMLARPT